MTSHDQLSYVTPGAPLGRRLMMRAIENLSGRRRLLPLYNQWSKDWSDGRPGRWNDALRRIGTTLDIDGPPDGPASVAAGPLIMIANHPFGLADGIAMLALAERLGRPARIILNADFMRVPELVDQGLPIDFAETKAALKTNLETRARARRLLEEGTAIIIFPAGGVATADAAFGRAEELPWKRFAVRLVQQSGADVLPVYFQGQNSRAFQWISRHSLTLRLALLVSEFRNQIGGTIRATVGAPASAASIVDAGVSAIDPLDRLYLLVHRLAPHAAGLDDKSLLPRPIETRRRFPWDPPRDATPAVSEAAQQPAIR